MATPCSDDSNATVESKPTWEWDPAGPKGDFARLIPSTPAARRSFNDVVRRLLGDAEWAARAERIVNLIEFTNDHEDDDSHEFVGYFRFNFEKPPLSLEQGWIIGSDPAKCDFILTAETKQYDVKARAVQILLHNMLNVLSLRAHQDVLFNGHEHLQAPSSGARHPHTRAVVADSGLQIGDLGFILASTTLPQDTVTTQFSQARRDAGLGSAKVPEILFQSHTKTITYGKYEMVPARRSGASAMVHMAFHSNRIEPVAIKKMRRTCSSANAIVKEIEMLRRMHHDNVIQLVEADVPARSREELLQGADEVLLVLEPFASSTLLEAFDHGITTFRDQIRYLRDCADGLNYLHELGIMHRDVKSNNIGILAGKTRRRAVLLDLGHAIEAKTSIDHMKGTVRYLAPEIIALKNKTGFTPYDRSSDMFSLGLSFWEINCERVDWHYITANLYTERILNALNDKQVAALPGNGEATLVLKHIKEMIAWHPKDRITAKVLLKAMEASMPETREKDRKRSGETSVFLKSSSEAKRARDQTK